MISLDSETTGLNLHHGCKPFFVTMCDRYGQQHYWEWPVDPITRQPEIPETDKRQIRSHLPRLKKVKVRGRWVDQPLGNDLVGHNINFDIKALASIGVIDPLNECNGERLDWTRIHDTTLTDHILCSNQQHRLTACSIRWLGENIDRYEDDLRKVVLQCRNLVRKYNRTQEWKRWKGTWRICEKGQAEHPSMGTGKDNKLWKADYWLPRAICMDQGYEEDHEWWHVTRRYANTDSAITLLLWKEHEDLLKKKDLWDIYLLRQQLLPIVQEMESKGVTLSGSRLLEQEQRFKDMSEKLATRCLRIARSYGYALELPKGAANNNSLKRFCFGTGELNPVKRDEGEVQETYLDLPVVKWTETGQPSLDVHALEEYTVTLPERSSQLIFIKALADKRKCDKAISDLEQYKRYWIHRKDDVYVLHPNLNPTGTDTLRWSSNNPNSQNISTKTEFNLRESFGPMEGREWYALDYRNLELMLPAYKAGEEKMIYLFENPDKEPYFGSQHLAVCDLLFPKLFAKYYKESFDEYGPDFFKKRDPTRYKWVKNGNFASQYGAMEVKTDSTFHVKGAYQMVRNLYPKITALKDSIMAKAERDGYIETMADKEFGKGYPLFLLRSEYGKIEPTKPFSYYIQGTACWVMMRAKIRVANYLKSIRTTNYDPRIVLQVHDELDLDFPSYDRARNRHHVKEVKRIMELSGDDIGVPIKVSVEVHKDTWGKSVSLAI